MGRRRVWENCALGLPSHRPLLSLSSSPPSPPPTPATPYQSLVLSEQQVLRSSSPSPSPYKQEDWGPGQSVPVHTGPCFLPLRGRPHPPVSGPVSFLCSTGCQAEVHFWLSPGDHYAWWLQGEKTHSTSHSLGMRELSWQPQTAEKIHFSLKKGIFFFLIGTEDSQYPLKLFFFPVIIFQPWIIRISF